MYCCVEIKCYPPSCDDDHSDEDDSDDSSSELLFILSLVLSFFCLSRHRNQCSAVLLAFDDP